jgi:hypothetical protein
MFMLAGQARHMTQECSRTLHCIKSKTTCETLCPYSYSFNVLHVFVLVQDAGQLAARREFAAY